MTTASKTHKKPRTIASAFGTLADVVMAGASWVSVLGLWLVAASVYVSPAQVRLAGIAGLGFPLMLCGTLFCLFMCLLFAPRRSWISLLGLLLCAGSIRSYFPINPFTPSPVENAFTVMTYNCHGFPEAGAGEARDEVLDYLCSTRADIICFQESYHKVDEWKDLPHPFLKIYSHYSCPYPTQSTYQACFSRYPILRHELVTSHTQNAVVAFWLQMPAGDSLLVLNCHLQSNNLSPEDRTQYNKMLKHQSPQHTADSTLHTSRTLASKISTSAGIRALMADTVALFLERHAGVPTIVCGDFNDTPISYSTYRMKRAGLNDAFRMAGSGMGRSFNTDAMPVRIDHQFCSDHLQPASAFIDKTALWSDHYPLIATYNRRTPKPHE